MEQQDARQTVSPEEDARIAATPATFANKVYLTPLPSGAKITFAETHRIGGKDEVSPRVAVFLQHGDLHALHRLLEATVKAGAAPEQKAPRALARGERTRRARAPVERGAKGALHMARMFDGRKVQ